MDASYAQTSFLGGEISQWAQGQFDKPWYKISMARCFNAHPADEGACPRRPGTQLLGLTRNGNPGRVIPFDFTEANPYNLELTDSTLRMWNGTQLVTTNDNQVIASISNASPAVFTLPNTVTWKTGDQCIFSFSTPANAITGAILLNRQCTMTMLTNKTFTCVDSVTSAVINGATINTLTPTVGHVASIVTPYINNTSTDWHSVRAVQGQNLSMLLHGAVAPQALLVLEEPTPTTFASFEFTPALFQDGPYLDPPPSSTATPVGTSGVIQITVGYNAWSSTITYGIAVPVTYGGQDYISLQNNNTNHTPNSSPTFWQALTSGAMVGPNGFVATDVGRMIRLFSEPAAWSPVTTYAVGNTVKYNGQYFTSLANSNTNNEPDISLTDWVINTSAAVWTWGTITQVLSANSVQLQLQGANLLYTVPIQTWRLGAWSNTTGWPTCGCYQEGRFWFFGAVPNRLDSSQPNAPFNMAPTGQDGTVSDNNAITYILNADSVNPIFWGIPDDQGVLLGTQEGEWLLTSGTAGTPMTPSNVQARRRSKYGVANVLPVKTGLSLCFVQRYARRLIEYLIDVFSQRFYGPDLTVNARHLGARMFQELAYQQELIPIVWGRMGDGSFVGTTYRRVSLFSTQPPEFNGWHQHQLGSSRLVESICVGPAAGGALDALAMVTNDPSTNLRFVESLTTLMDETDPLSVAWFLDTATTPAVAQISGNNVIFYGLNNYNGRTVSIFAAAIDCGDYIVQNGQVSVPLKTVDATTGAVFDRPQFLLLQPTASVFSDMAVSVVDGANTYSIPCVIGYNYLTQGQLCRPMAPADTGAKNGPGFGKKRRSARYAIYAVNSLGMKVGTKFTKMHPIPMTTPGGKPLGYLQTYTGIVRETLDDDFSFDSQICWQTTRPFPATVAALGGFIETQDV